MSFRSANRAPRESSRRCVLALVAAAAFVLATNSSAVSDDADPYLWLEDVGGERALTWVKERNAQSTAELTADPQFAALEARVLQILDSKEKLPFIEKRGEHYYNFWRDETHPRGIWRRTSLEEYRKPQPAWETVIDVDALGRSEKVNWVWRGANWLEPARDRCLVSLSRGGADAHAVREFDPKTKTFVKDGFALPEGKHRLSWKDRDTLLVGTDFGPGSLTDSGYPRVAKEWKRGTPLGDATWLFEGRQSDAGVSSWKDNTPGFEREFVERDVTRYDSELYLRRDGKLVRIEKPADAQASTYRDLLVLELRSPWRVGERTYAAGSLLASDFDAFLAGARKFDVLFEPAERRSLERWAATRDHLLVTELDNVRSRVHVLTRDAGAWKKTELPGVPKFGHAVASAVDSDFSNDYFLTVDDFLTPVTLSLGTAGKDTIETLKQAPAFFDAKELVVEQHEATSKDGTKIPYFQVARRDLVKDGTAPTLLFGYGGFEISMTPGYRASVGAAWLEKGGVYALANIRGGGEFGPAWHQAALKANRPRSYEDFAAVAEDLVARKVTSPKRLGIRGGSNGGLLMGNMLVQYPQLFGAIVCQVPLLDMRRYHKLLAGASWMAEYGNPDDPKEWEFIRTFSPYDLVKKDVKYPRTLFTTSTRDDRVHPGHARKMAARMQEIGDDVLYYENIEGGHGGAADNRQTAFVEALAFTFLWKELRRE
jgi:prolyl oligopeptidase